MNAGLELDIFHVVKTSKLVIFFVLVLSAEAGAQQWRGFNGPSPQQMQDDLNEQRRQIEKLRNDAQQERMEADFYARKQMEARATPEPLVTYINGVPQPPVLINSIKSGTRALNEARTKAYLAALAEYNAKVAQQQQAAAQAQQRDQQIAALQREMARVTAELQRLRVVKQASK